LNRLDKPAWPVDRRLYREHFATPEDYCQARCQTRRDHGYRLIAQATAIVRMHTLAPIGGKLANEAQPRELARVPHELKGHVLRLAVELAKWGDLNARLIRLAASELGVDGGAPLLPRNGDDRVQTPDALARAVVEHFLPCGRIVEPSSGNGAFLRALPKGAGWYEIEKGKDFLRATGHWDWAVGSPSFSQFRAFLQKAVQVADNLVSHRAGPILCSLMPYTTSKSTSGWVRAMRSNTLAGPVGERRPCSQFCSVSVLMPRTAANFDCDNSSLVRTFTTSFFGSNLNVRTGFNSPFSMALACFTLSNNSSNNAFFMAPIGFSILSVGWPSGHPARSSDTPSTA
jgi:hypothetical protein